MRREEASSPGSRPIRARLSSQLGCARFNWLASGPLADEERSRRPICTRARGGGRRRRRLRAIWPPPEGPPPPPPASARTMAAGRLFARPSALARPEQVLLESAQIDHLRGGWLAGWLASARYARACDWPRSGPLCGRTDSGLEALTSGRQQDRAGGRVSYAIRLAWRAA